MDLKSKAYACWNIKEEERRYSSSGGIYVLLAKEIIKNNGVIFAVCYDEKFEAVHMQIELEEDLFQSMGSKYMPSKLNDTFISVKRILLQGRQVMFVGTPCQCAGLKKYIGEKDDNLICIDMVCHGVPSRSVWRNYLQNLDKNKLLEYLNMRDKSSGWSRYQYSWKMKYKDDTEKVILQENIPFMKGFTMDFYLRPSCYECQFKGINRSADITLGDFWGAWEMQPEMDDNKGTSLILIHSRKGERLIEKISSNLKIQEVDIEAAVKYNPSIIKSPLKSPQRRIFFQKMKSEDNIEKIITEITKQKLIDRIIIKSKYFIGKIFG